MQRASPTRERRACAQQLAESHPAHHSLRCSQVCHGLQKRAPNHASALPGTWCAGAVTGASVAASWPWPWRAVVAVMLDAAARCALDAARCFCTSTATCSATRAFSLTFSFAAASLPRARSASDGVLAGAAKPAGHDDARSRASNTPGSQGSLAQAADVHSPVLLLHQRRVCAGVPLLRSAAGVVDASQRRKWSGAPRTERSNPWQSCWAADEAARMFCSLLSAHTAAACVVHRRPPRSHAPLESDAQQDCELRLRAL